jgi:4-deoxy-L-threo-5-hexosulose-uronate ketol-isomerase
MHVDKRQATHPELIRHLTTADLRRHYLLTELFKNDELSLVHSHVERMVIGGALPVSKPVTLADCPALAKGPLLDRRELGVINIGGDGIVTVDGRAVRLLTREGLYVPSGTQRVVFESVPGQAPARFYLVSTPAATSHELVHITLVKRMPMPMGSATTSNERVIYQYVHPEICRSSQLLLGLTALAPGSVWNTMPCHLHERRSEVYFYFDLKPDARVFHMMGEPSETRHVVVANEQAVISPPWSIHTGCGTANYAFIWAMGGENQDYKDMDGVPMDTLR